MELFASVEGRPHTVVGWHVYKHDSSKAPEEFFFCNLHGFLELLVRSFGCRSVPLGVGSGDAGAESCGDVVFHVFGFTDTVVQSVHLKDQLLIHLLEHFFKTISFKSDTPVVFASVGDDLPPKVLVDEAGAAELGYVSGFVFPGLFESRLVMVESVPSWIIDAANINHNVKLVEDVFLTRPDNDRVGKLACLEEHDGGKDFVAMERVRVGAHQLLLSLGLKRVKHFHVFGAHDGEVFRDTARVLQVFSEFGDFYLNHFAVKS